MITRDATATRVNAFWRDQVSGRRKPRTDLLAHRDNVHLCGEKAQTERCACTSVRLTCLASSLGRGTLFAQRVFVLPNVRANRPAMAGGVRLVCEGAEGAAHQLYAGCRSGSG